MSLVLNIPEPGQLVDVRKRRYVVVDVAQSVFPPELLKSSSLNTRHKHRQFNQSQHLVTLTSVEDDAPGEGLHVNPWTHFPRLITSIAFLKRERPLCLFSGALPANGEPTYPRKFDLPMADEAHNIAPSGRGQLATNLLHTHALRRLTPHFEHTLFLSATHHNGYPESFTFLLELMDNQNFTRGLLEAPETVYLTANSY